MKTRSEMLREKAEMKKLPIWERKMNPEQLEAIRHDKGPCRLLASAGSGKTRVLTHRIARLVHTGTNPKRICAMTFSKKAADEMDERIKKLDVSDARVGTWHALCLQILREDNTRWADWDIDKRAKSKFILKDVLGYKHMNWKGADLSAMTSYIGKCKANLFAPDSEGAAALAKFLFSWNDKKALEAFHRYNEQLEQKEILTFDDFLVFVAQHLSDEDNRTHWSSKWDYLIQDESQDANLAQIHIANLLARDHRNYMVVGDVFQAIYSFRGSSPEYLAQFDKEWHDCKTIWMGRNYRSGKAIVDAANGIVRPARVPGYQPQDMIAERSITGAVIESVSEDLDDEANKFVDWIKHKVEVDNFAYENFTCLFRTNAQSRALEEGLLASKIPYVVVGGHSFYERKEVRDLLAYIRVAADMGELEDIKRCINTPFRFLGAAFVGRIQEVAEGRSDIHWPQLVVEVSQQERIQSRQKTSAEEWANIIEHISTKMKLATIKEATPDQKKEGRPSELLDFVIRRTRYIDWVTKEEGEESIETSGAANVRELIRVAERFASIEELLDYIDDTIKRTEKQRNDKQAGGDRVLLMSVHRSKGLEWPFVWVAGFNEMILPHIKGDPEEERRLAYVAATRARDELVLSHVRTLATRAGIKDAQPSRFLKDAFQKETSQGFNESLPTFGPLSLGALAGVLNAISGKHSEDPSTNSGSKELHEFHKVPGMDPSCEEEGQNS